MKKSLSLLLSALTLASAMTACAPTADQLDPAITLASSDATAKAEWLADRLDVIPDDVILGIGSNDSYGIDMTDFEDDGYIARAIGGEVLLFGKTAEGLDRAVREYAKAADVGATSELDTVYHEGVRVEKMTIAGRDISEFTVVYTNDRETIMPNGTCLTAGNAKPAAEEFVRLVQFATGVTLPIATHEDKVNTPVVRIDYVTDGSCGENGFTYEVRDGNLYINGATEANGCVNGVYYFLEYECGWDGLMFGDSDLREAELADIPEGTAHSVDPILDYLQFRVPYTFSFKNVRASWAQGYRGVYAHANHGMQRANWSGTFGEGYQICYTNESNYFNTFGKVYEAVTAHVNAGDVLGETVTQIDIAQADYFGYCLCKECSKVFKEEGKVHSGAVLRFANRLAADMEAEGLGGLMYQIFAYHGSNPPPQKTVARNDVAVTFVFDGACANHPLDGSECFGVSFDMAGYLTQKEFNNNDYAKWLAGWTDICNDVYVWHYGMPHNYGTYTYYRNIYSDMQYLKDAGVKGMYLEGEYNGLGFGRLRPQLMNAVIYNPDLSEEEYNVLRDEIMKREYGDGYDYIQDYIDILEETERGGDRCWNCWGYGNLFNAGNYDIGMFYERAEECLDILENALKFTSTEQQEKLIRTLYLEVYYRQCAIGYFKAYDEGDTEMITYLEGQYAKFIENSYLAGIVTPYFDGDWWPMGFGEVNHNMRGFKAETNLEDAAWIRWLEYRDDLTYGDREQRPMPDKWVEYYETSAEAGS